MQEAVLATVARTACGSKDTTNLVQCHTRREDMPTDADLEQAYQALQSEGRTPSYRLLQTRCGISKNRAGQVFAGAAGRHGTTEE